MDIQSILNTYCRLLLGIKTRHAILNSVLTTGHGLPEFAIAEFCQLQIRMICETFAIACLVAHGDVEGTRTGKLTRAYEADLIINALSKLHPHFYPRPGKQQGMDGKITKVDWVTDGYLTKQELISSYRASSGYLHGRTLQDVLGDKPRLIDPNTMVRWAQKLAALLDHHSIYLADPPGEPPGPIGDDGIPAPKRQIISMMQPDGEWVPKSWLFSRVDDFQQECAQPPRDPHPEG